MGTKKGILVEERLRIQHTCPDTISREKYVERPDHFLRLLDDTVAGGGASKSLEIKFCGKAVKKS